MASLGTIAALFLAGFNSGTQSQPLTAEAIMCARNQRSTEKLVS
jgi:hypothetical protein